MKKRFSVYEACNGYYLEDLVTGRVACLGDGVGIDFGRTEDHVVTCGMPGFTEAWTEEVNTYVDEMLEACFYDLYALEIYDNPKFCDRYTVIVEESSSLEKLLQDCPGLHDCLCLSHNPGSPQGVSIWDHADLEFMAKTAERISFLDLPPLVQQYIAKELGES